jgi:hypothetical protein
MSPERVAHAPRGHFTARARHSRDAPQRRPLTRVKRGGTVTSGRRLSRTDVPLKPTLLRAHAESGASTSQACFFLERARAHVASTRGNRRRARASAGHSISEWSNGAPCARGASPASRPRGDARSRGVVSREIHGFSRDTRRATARFSESRAPGNASLRAERRARNERFARRWRSAALSSRLRASRARRRGARDRHALPAGPLTWTC